MSAQSTVRGPLAFVAMWIAGLAVGVLGVFLVLGGGFGWLLWAALPASALAALILLRGRRKP